ncbi:MAG TPA: Spy/CpxP family protein refolding chaperone [Hyphomicrobiaceae bacterium]|nr:Spy/CpxP family protein refolding chaperone [Hyphomicrobiaceae bacterium]
MRANITKYLAPAVLAAVIPAGVVLAQQAQPQPSEPAQKREWPERPRLSPDAMKRLQEGRLEGRIAEIKEALKLNDAQLKLWAPVEQQLRASFAARQQARQQFRDRMEQRRQQGSAAQDLALPDRLDRVAKRMSERAQRMQAFTEAFKPFYAALSDEQKAVAGVVLRDLRGPMHGYGHGSWRRWAMERGSHPGGAGPGGGAQPR